MVRSLSLKNRAHHFLGRMLFGIAIGFVVIGICIFMTGLYFSILGVVALGISLISLALALIAKDNEAKSGARMTAMANLEFETRLGSIKTTLRERPLSIVAATNNVVASSWPNCYRLMWLPPDAVAATRNVVTRAGFGILNDLRAMVTIAECADESRRENARQVLHGLLEHIDGLEHSEEIDRWAAEVRQLYGLI